ncbi:MAG: DUF481 domain-containing protein [Saprospiraceae bacterium]|nr:hypothetical protein [Lewinella sp.]
MKKGLYLLIALSFFIQFDLRAQSGLLSPNFSGSLLSGDPGNAQFRGDYSFMTSDRWMLGLGTKADIITGLRVSSDTRSSSYIATMGPLARYYFSPSGARLRWFGQGQAGLGNARIFRQSAANEYIPDNHFAYSLNLGTGFSWKVNPGLVLESTLNYGYDKIADFAASQSLTLDVGLRSFFSGKTEQGNPEPDQKWLLNGNLQLGRNLARHYPNNINLNVEGLRFLSPHLALGGRLNYRQQTFNNSFDSNSSVLETAAQGRYYLNPKQKLKLFMLGEVGIKNDFSNNDLQLTARAGLGINYYLTDRMALEFTAGPSWNSGQSGRVLWANIGIKYLIGK